MKKKDLRNILIGASAVAGIICASQADAGTTCYQVMQNGKSVAKGSIPTTKSAWNTGNFSCKSSNNKATAGVCGLNWYSASTLETIGFDSSKLSTLCPLS